MPVSTFAIQVGADDGFVSANGASYPPGGTPTVQMGENALQMNKELFAGDYYIDVGVLRWNTSSLQGASVTGVQLQVDVIQTDELDGPSLVAEWYDPANWPITVAAYTDSVGSDALSIPLLGLATGIQAFALTNPSSVNSSGYTALRLGISGGAPVNGRNWIQFASLEDPTLQEARLIVTYEPGRPDYSRFPKAKLRSV